MLSPALGLFFVLAAYGSSPTPSPPDLTVWWRTVGAEVIEHHTETGARACSLVLHHSDNVLMFMWPQHGQPTLFVRHPGWHFGDQQGATDLQINVGNAGRGPGLGDGVTTQLPAADFQDWVRAQLDQTLAQVLPTEDEIRVALPGGQFSPVSFSIDQERMPAVMRGLDKCKTALGVAG